MGEYLEEYGTLIVEAFTGVILMSIMYYAVATGSGVLNQSFFDEGSYSPVIKTYIDYPAEPRPELSVYHELSLRIGEEFDARDCVRSAYGQKSFDLYLMTPEESRSTSAVKAALRPGVVCVKDADKVKTDGGSCEVTLYAKAEGRLGLWAEEHCIVTYY